MVFICSDCNVFLDKEVLHSGEYYKCRSCGIVVKKEAIFSALDKNLAKLLVHGQSVKLDADNNSYNFVNMFLESVIEHMGHYCEGFDFNIIENFVNVILESDNIFIFGVGRSGLVGKNFIIQLVKLDLKSFFYGDNESPIIKKGDCLIALSGSGESKAVLENVGNAKRRGCKILSLTNNPDSSLAKLSDHVWIVDGKEPVSVNEHEERLISGEYVTLSPMGTIFELSSMIMLDSLIGELILALNINEFELKKKKI